MSSKPQLIAPLLIMIVAIPFGHAATTLDSHFPYGAQPDSNLCTSSDHYATPETMLGSWAMQQAVASDIGNVLPTLFTTDNVVYAVGTAAIGDQLGIPNCSGGCNQLNGYCFALKFNDKSNYPYMIFQSVNIGANPNSFDIYMPGGGSGAFPEPCAKFWGTGGTVNWANNIQNTSSCAVYFNDFTSITSPYSVTYADQTHTAKDTLIEACAFSSSAQTGFNTKNFDNVTVVPVTCPTSLTQITGVKLTPASKVGTQTIHELNTITEGDFQSSALTHITTTQMQDCKTPSSGYCGNLSNGVSSYQASISADLTAPIITGQHSTDNECQQHPSGYCSWNEGQSSGGEYCNQAKPQCLQNCGGYWCVCHAGKVSCSIE